MRRFELKINGKPVTIEADEATPLLFLLRNDLGLKGARLGCGAGDCGACTVIVNRRAVQSCTTPLWSIDQAEITTIEGLENDPLPQAFIDGQAGQCGYCVTGIIMTARALLDREPQADDQTIAAELAERHLCRCGAHRRILDAIAQVRDGAGS